MHDPLAATLLGDVLDQENRRIILVRSDAGNPDRAPVGELDGRRGQCLRHRDEALGQRAELGSAERHADLDRLAPENGQGTVVGECDVAIAIDPDDRMREP